MEGNLFLKIVIIFLGCTGSSLPRGLSLIVASTGYSLGAVHECFIAVASLVAEHRL